VCVQCRQLAHTIIIEVALDVAKPSKFKLSMVIIYKTPSLNLIVPNANLNGFGLKVKHLESKPSQISSAFFSIRSIELILCG